MSKNLRNFRRRKGFRRSDDQFFGLSVWFGWNSRWDVVFRLKVIESIYLPISTNHNVIEWWTISLQFTKTSLLLPLTYFTWRFLGIQWRFSLLRYADLITLNRGHLKTANQADRTRPSIFFCSFCTCFSHASSPTACFFCKSPCKNSRQTKSQKMAFPKKNFARHLQWRILWKLQLQVGSLQNNCGTKS